MKPKSLLQVSAPADQFRCQYLTKPRHLKNCAMADVRRRLDTIGSEHSKLPRSNSIYPGASEMISIKEPVQLARPRFLLHCIEFSYAFLCQPAEIDLYPE